MCRENVCFGVWEPHQTGPGFGKIKLNRNHLTGYAVSIVVGPGEDTPLVGIGASPRTNNFASQDGRGLVA
ncbi:MAG: hypothetical protein HW380_481 [Magnetococcales bacterium]|nr:hypothetical protein [Magnetococcales bacterium]